MENQDNFSFPFEPYPIQIGFMKTLYKALEDGNLGIFESPTGTGKSLSLCCGALRWLLDYESSEISSLTEKIDDLKLSIKSSDSDEGDWLNSEFKKIQSTSEMNNLIKKLEVITKYNEKIENLRTRKKQELNDKENNLKWRSKTRNKIEENLLEKVEDDQKDLPLDDDLIIESANLETDSVEDEVEDSEVDIEDNRVKIFFCSRTHSQLSQFVNEIKRTDYSSQVRVVSLASRQQYCINPAVQRLKSSHLINERCLDLQKGKKGKTTSKSEDGKVTKKSKCSSGCQFNNQTSIEVLRDEALIEIRDVEDLVSAAKEVEACPYYSARAAVKYSQVIIVPYQTLLHEATRRANGINVKDNILIIDEAHNLLDTIEHIHSAQVSGYQLQTALDKLKHYREKFNSRFAAKNLLLLNQVIFVIGKILGLLKSPAKVPESDERKIYTLEEFVLSAEIDNYNLRPLLNFCTQSKLAQKLHGFAERYPHRLPEEDKKSHVDVKHHLQSFLTKMSEEKVKNKKKIVEKATPSENQSIEPEKHVSVGNVIQSVIGFLEMLTSNYSDGRISTYRAKTVDNGYHKFLLLNPAAQFTDIVRDARSVILAGGTMQPFSEFRDQLFLLAGAKESRIMEFSCDHVIPPENILPICLSAGPSGKRLNFSYEFRNSPEMIGEFGRVLQNICNVVPGGIVCFFPSYDYENIVFKHLNSSGILDKIGNKKKMFREPKTTSQVDQVLEEYSKVIKRSKNTTLTGALMFSVVGGKLSEGLNFSDDLGRCVIVVGMPYPNIKSIELQEKMKYLNENVSATAGNTHYENICLKAVNQCIGRAVRHSNDYATVILIDERFSRENVSNALPKWIQKSLLTNCKFGPMFGAISKFFAKRKVPQ